MRGREITNLPHTTLLAYHNPTFQDYVGRWYDAAAAAGRRAARIPRGPDRPGPARATRSAWCTGCRRPPITAPATEERYREFLRERYRGDIGAAEPRLRERRAPRLRGDAQPASGDDRQPARLLLRLDGASTRSTTRPTSSRCSRALPRARPRAAGAGEHPAVLRFRRARPRRVQPHDLDDVPRLPRARPAGDLRRRLSDAAARLRELPRHRHHHRSDQHDRRPRTSPACAPSCRPASCATGRGSTPRTWSST